MTPEKKFAHRLQHIGDIISGEDPYAQPAAIHFACMTPGHFFDTEDTKEIKADRWKNLYFSKSGKPYRGYMVHPSEAAARKAGEENTYAVLHSDFPGWSTMDGVLMKVEYSHFIPVPWLKD